MIDTTKQGEENREREDEKMSGQPVEKAHLNNNRPGNSSRDKGVSPSEDSPREGHSTGK